MSNMKVSSGVTTRVSGGIYKAASVHGGGFGGSRISVSRVSAGSARLGSGFGGGAGFGGGLGIIGGAGNGMGSSFGASFGAGGEGLLSGNGKHTMQNLNDRLASYLERVRSLEKANNDLEVKIHDWYSKQGSASVSQQSFGVLYGSIDDLHDKISIASVNNSSLILEIDNARLAADDFKVKYENELSLRQGIEADINGLKHILDDLTMARSDLELQIESLKEELIYLKTNYEEEVSDKKQHASGTVNVELDAAPGVDLLRTINELRQQYELIAENNRREAEARFLNQVETLQSEAVASTQQVQTTRSESTELRRNFQNLETELQSQLSAKASLETLAAEVEGRYSAQLLQMQSTISRIEAQLGDLRSDLEQQNQKYRALLDIKTRLEQEIITYHQLLEGEGGRIASSAIQSASSSSKSTSSSKVQAIIKEEIGGKVISSTTKTLRSY